MLALRPSRFLTCDTVLPRRFILALALWGSAILPGTVLAQDMQLKGQPKVEFTNSDPAKLGALKRVAITNVIVEVQTRVFAEQITGRLSKLVLNRQNTYADNTLAGFDPKAMEEVANRLYKKLADDLTAAGYEVVPQDEVVAQPLYKKLVETMGYPQGGHLGNVEGNSVLFGPTALKLYLPPVGERGIFTNNNKNQSPYQGPTVSWGTNATMAGESTYTNGREVELAQALNAHVVKAWYMVGFGKAEAYTGWDAVDTPHFATTASSNTKASAQMYVREGQSRIAFRTPNGDKKYGRNSSGSSMFTRDEPAWDGDVVIRLNEMVIGQSDFLASGVEEAQKAGGLMGMLTSSFNSKSYETKVDGKKFADAAYGMLSQIQPVILAKLAQPGNAK